MRNNKLKIITISGFSGCGKDTIVKELAKLPDVNIITPITSRPMRDSENQGNPYEFCTKEEFETYYNNGDLLEYYSYDTLLDGKEDTWYYGSLREDYKEDKINIIQMGVEAAEVFSITSNHDITTIFIDVPDDIREQRSKQRGSFCQTEWDRRLKDDNRVFNSIVTDFIFIENTNLEETINNIKNLIST